MSDGTATYYCARCNQTFHTDAATVKQEREAHFATHRSGDTDKSQRTFAPVFEYAIAMSNNARFYTGGFDSIESLRGVLAGGDDIAGLWKADPDLPWQACYLNPAQIVAITDLRGE